MQPNGLIRIAVQKAGRLLEGSLGLLRQMGLEIETYKDRLFAHCRNLPVDVLFLRDDDIPEYVQDGVADMGIIGSNLLEETGVVVDRLLSLNFGFCSLCLAVPEQSRITSVPQLNGKRIATSYPATLQRYLDRQGIAAKVVVLRGSVEIAPALQIAEAVCDLVSTGSTLRTHGLKILATVLHSQAVLVARQKLNGEKRALMERLLLRARGVEEARKYRYVMFNIAADAVEAVKRFLPGCKSPTVVPLAEPGYVAVHTMLLEETFWEVVERISSCGGTDIIVTPVEKFLR